MADQTDLLFQLEALKKENAALRGQQPPAQEPTTPQQEPEKPSKLDAVLAGLIEQCRELALPNDPSVDQVKQTALRTQALCKVVESLIKCVGGGFGATGTVLTKLNEGLGVLDQKIEGFAQGGQGQQQVVVASEDGQTEAIEVDNTGAPPDHPAVVAAAAAQVVPASAPKAGNGKKPPQRASAPAPAPVGPPPPAGMPVEVAQLAQVPSAPIATVTVK